MLSSTRKGNRHVGKDTAIQDPGEEMLTTEEVASAKNVSRAYVITAIKEKRLRAYDITNGEKPQYRVKRADMDAWWEAKATAPEA